MYYRQSEHRTKRCYTLAIVISKLVMLVIGAHSVMLCHVGLMFLVASHGVKYLGLFCV